MDSTTPSPRRRRSRRAGLATSLALISAVAFSACAAPDAAGEAEAPAIAAESIQINDGWVKAVDEGMTAAFGTIQNDGDADITLVAASSPVSPMMELHEVVMNDGAMVMQQKEGGIVIAAASMHELAPGNDHIMMMGVNEALLPGDEVMITLEFSDGSTLEHSFTVKEFSGADEEYVGGMGHTEDE